jgi:putative membrane protein
MKSLTCQIPRITAGLLLVFVVLLAARAYSATTTLLVATSIAMFAACWASAIHLLGTRAALRFVLIATTIGWAAEQLGSSYGWFFGSYTYTSLLGPTLGNVPVVIPLMWFGLAYIGHVTANLIVWQAPSDGPAPLIQALVMSLLAAMIVTAYDLGADPYMVYKLGAWTMAKRDGWWFGETLQGFVGWMLVSFVIVFAFRLSVRSKPPVPALPVGRRHALVPLLVYGANMAFQACLGYPVETRTVAVFAMGIPLLAALCGFVRWPGPASARTGGAA